MATIILEQRFEGRPFDVERFNAAQRRNAPCLRVHGVHHTVSYVTRDGLRMICVFEAPDAESVRDALRSADIPFDRVWSSDVYAVEDYPAMRDKLEQLRKKLAEG